MLGTGKGVRTFARDSGSSEALGIMVFCWVHGGFKWAWGFVRFQGSGGFPSIDVRRGFVERKKPLIK